MSGGSMDIIEEKKDSVMGRPKIEINWEEFDKLCGLLCTLEDIAGYFNCSEDTIERRCKEELGETFAEDYKQRCSKGRVSIRRQQMRVAMDGNPAMLIWLGKQHLGQKEPERDLNVRNVDIDDETLQRMKADFAYDIEGESDTADTV